jgi:hypothetical protein
MADNATALTKCLIYLPPKNVGNDLKVENAI